MKNAPLSPSWNLSRFLIFSLTKILTFIWVDSYFSRSGILKFWNLRFWDFEIWDFDISKSEIFEIWDFEILKSEILRFWNLRLWGAFLKKPFYRKRTLGKMSVIISLKKVRFFINIGGKVLRYYFAYENITSYFFFYYLSFK